MKKEVQATIKPRLKVCADLKAHVERQAQTAQQNKTAAECVDNVCSLSDWKPRKQEAA